MACVLLVDDEPMLRAVLCEYLRFAGHTVVECCDGDEALGRLRETPVDIVVSDVLMPGMDGLALCGAMRADASLAKIPVLFVTARNVDADMQAEMDRIGDGSLFKPFEPDALLAAIRTAVSARATS
jgi:two-component system, OmpR family, response regulator BaeR